ncbi:recombination protein RecR [Hyphobacterium sp. CCMP332]|nr:recombination protein RecR [Hyphobacterium sp. CCMP332]
MQYPSRLIEKAVEEFSRLPGIGSKTALRLVLHLLKKDKSQSQALSESIQELREKIRYCEKCCNISDKNVCEICANPGRDTEILCVVQDVRDVMAIENTGQYRGLYHVLGGIISPIEGISPNELNIDSLLKRVKEEAIKEIIFALSSTMEADTTAFYISKKLKDNDVKMSSIARGIPIGGELEYADEITLARSISQRMTYRTD